MGFAIRPVVFTIIVVVVWMKIGGLWLGYGGFAD